MVTALPGSVTCRLLFQIIRYLSFLPVFLHVKHKFPTTRICVPFYFLHYRFDTAAVFEELKIRNGYGATGAGCYICYICPILHLTVSFSIF